MIITASMVPPIGILAPPFISCSGSSGDSGTNDDGPGYGNFLVIFSVFQRWLFAGMISGGVKS